MQLGLTKEGRHCCLAGGFRLFGSDSGSCLHFGLFAASTHVAGVLEQQQQQQQQQRSLFICLHWPALLAFGAGMLTLNLAAFIKPPRPSHLHCTTASPHRRTTSKNNCNLGAFLIVFRCKHVFARTLWC